MKKILLAAIIVCTVSNIIAQAPTAGLVAYWPMDGNLTDAGPYSINGTNVGATATTNSQGTANKALLYTNPASLVPQYGTHPINSNLSFTGAQDFTITFSVYANSPFVHTGGFYDNNLNGGGPGVWFWNANGFPQIQFNYKNASVGTTSGAFPVGAWKRIACVRASGTLKIYINGVIINSAAEGATTPVYTIPARFGTMSYFGYSPPEYNGFNGKLDDVRIYNRALTLAEIVILAVLPVKLTSFTAVKNNSDILLNWQTASEQNCDHFNVQRSTDGSNFITLAEVKAVGNTSVSTNYHFTDLTAKNLAGVQTVFYRLESVDIDAKKDYSSIISVRLGADKDGLLVLQNPAVNDLRIQLLSTVKEVAQIIITDAAGRQLITKQMQLNIGTVSTAIPISLLAKGLYYVTVSSSQGKQTRSFLR